MPMSSRTCASAQRSASRSRNRLSAIAILDQALAQSPGYVPAMAYKAWCHGHRRAYFWTDDPEADLATVQTLHTRAAPLAQDDPNALVALAAALSLATSEFETAEAYVTRALTLDPNNAWGWMRRGWNLIYLQRPHEALDAFDVAWDLSPLDPFQFNICFGQSAALRGLKRYDEAVRLIERGLQAGPGVVWAYRMLFGT